MDGEIASPSEFHKSYSAARGLRTPISIVSRRIAELEEQLGVRLLDLKGEIDIIGHIARSSFGGQKTVDFRESMPRADGCGLKYNCGSRMDRRGRVPALATAMGWLKSHRLPPDRSVDRYNIRNANWSCPEIARHGVALIPKLRKSTAHGHRPSALSGSL